MPMISGCGNMFKLSSVWRAILDDRNQLFETIKRGGAGLRLSVVKPLVLNAMHRLAFGFGQGRRRGHNIIVEIQKF